MNPIPEFGPGPSDDVVLFCPRCGGLDLRHSRVDVYDRGEDEAVVMQTVLINGRQTVSAGVPNEGSGNPSARRHGLTIEFRCELCDEPVTLTVAQHKGQTSMRWSAPVRGGAAG